ncbi:MAG: hypothetical protein ACM3VT_06445 [Solirubrobacterales bacterium]
MKRKAACMLLMAAVTFCLIGCKENKQASTKNQSGKATSKAPSGQGQGTVEPVPGGQGTAGGTASSAGKTGTGGTAGTAGGTAGTAGGTAGGAAGTAADTLAQQKNQYVQGAEQILNNMEQKLTAWQQQAGKQGTPDQQQKVQDLAKQAQTDLSNARAAVDKMRTATGTQLKDAKVAADQALQNAEATFKNLQSFMDQTQVTQAQ